MKTTKITIVLFLVLAMLAVGNIALANDGTGTVGTAYTGSAAALQSQGTVTYAVTAGSLPSGLSLNSSTGAVTGTPTTAGTYIFSITGTDNTGAFQVFTDTHTYTIVVSSGSAGGNTSNTGGTSVSHHGGSSYRSVTTPASPLVTIVTSPVTPSSSAYTPTLVKSRDFESGMTHAGIVTLQQFLNIHGFIVSASGAGSVGHETNFFGSLTRKALAAFQKAHGITPAVGYFGPKTKAYIKANY